MYIPNLGCVAIIGSSLLQLSNYIRHEWESKPVRINEVRMLYVRTPVVIPWTLVICLICTPEARGLQA